MKSFTFQFWIILLPQIPILLLLHTEGTRQVLRLQSVQEEQLDPGQGSQISWVAAHRQRCQARREFCMGGQHQSLNQWENILQRWCTQIITKTGFLFYRWVIWITEQTTDGAAMQLLKQNKKTNMLFHLIFSPKIDWHWSGGCVQWQQVQQGHPGISFPGNVLQVPPWDPEHSLLLGLPVPVGHAWLSSRTQMLRTTYICSYRCELAAPPLCAAFRCPGYWPEL